MTVNLGSRSLTPKAAGNRGTVEKVRGIDSCYGFVEVSETDSGSDFVVGSETAPSVSQRQESVTLVSSSPDFVTLSATENAVYT